MFKPKKIVLKNMSPEYKDGMKAFLANPMSRGWYWRFATAYPIMAETLQEGPAAKRFLKELYDTHFTASGDGDTLSTGEIALIALNYFEYVEAGGK